MVMSKIVKMKPSDYSQFSFRIDEEAKDELNQKLDEILKIQKKNKKEDEYSPKKNALILEALRRGLIAIEKDLIKSKK